VLRLQQSELALKNQLGQTEARLQSTAEELSVAKGEAHQLLLKQKEIEAMGEVERRRAAETAAAQERLVADRQAALELMGDKCARMEEEIAQLQQAVVDLAMKEAPGVLTTTTDGNGNGNGLDGSGTDAEAEQQQQQHDAELLRLKRETDAQLQTLRAEVASAQYMQTLYSPAGGGADVSLATYNPGATAALAQASAATKRASAAAVAEGVDDDVDEMRTVLGLGATPTKAAPLPSGARQTEP